MPLNEKEERLTLKVDDDAISDPLVGAVIAERYRTTACIGSGGMGAVYKAEHIALKKTIAIKVLNQDLVRDENAKQRFLIEAKAASQLNHPNLTAVHDYGMCADGSPYLVMDFVEGQSLAEILKVEGKMAPARAIHIFRQIAAGLSSAHKAGVVHRDLKPSNIVIGGTKEQDTVKIVDFGIAKIIGTADTEQVAVTRTGEVIGTPMYMSPEQCRGYQLDGRSDIYSLGCIMYEAIAGTAAFNGNTPMEVALKHINEAPPLLEDSPATSQIARAVARCLKKDPADRYNSMDELISDLADTVTAVQRPAGQRRSASFSKRVWMAVAIVAAIAGTWLYIHTSQIPGIDEWNMYIATGLKNYEQGHFAEAKHMFEEADKRSGIFPKNDPRRYRALHQIADLNLYNLNKPALTEPAYKQLVDVYEHQISDPVMLAEVSGDLAQVYWDRKKYPESEALFLRAIATAEQVNDQAEYARHLQNYGNKLLYDKRYTEAEPLLKKSLAVREARFGRDSIETAYSLEIIGNMYFFENDNESAKKYLSEAVQIRKHKLGKTNPFVARTYVHLGAVYDKEKDYEKAAEAYSDARDIYDSLGDPTLADTLVTLGEVYYRGEKYTQCGATLDRAISILEHQTPAQNELLSKALQTRAKASIGEVKSAKKSVKSAPKR